MFCLISYVANLHKLSNCFVGFVSVFKPFMCGSAASRHPGLITVAIKTIKNVSLLLTGGSCHRTRGAAGFFGNFPFCSLLTRLYPPSNKTTHPSFLLLPYSLRSARNSRNTLPILHETAPVAPGMRWMSRRSEGRHSIKFLNEKLGRGGERKKRKKKGWVVCRLHPLLVAWEGPTLWAERPQPPKTLVYILYY